MGIRNETETETETEAEAETETATETEAETATATGGARGGDGALGRVSRDDFDSYFRVEALGYDARDNDQVADWLLAHSSVQDRVVIRGFAPEIYALAHRRFGGRFFWTLFLTMPSRAYRREEWLAEDRADLERIRPRFVVALRASADGPDSPAFFLRMGYVARADLGAFEILERP